MLESDSHSPLGRVRGVDPRRVWQNEALDFTPWLRMNPDLLSEALEIDLEILDAEVSVGPFSVDLVGEDVTHGRRLIVENQLEPTDHAHLGQLLTYAAGLEAATIVWVSPSFREEHRSAIDWLNAHTDSSVAFFGLQLEVLQIGDSPMAPNLKPVASPNEWTADARRAVTQGEASELALGRQRFFEVALAELKKRNPTLTNARRVGLQSWFSLSGGRTGFGFNWSFVSDGTLRCELYIDTGDKDTNKRHFEELARRREELEAATGRSLIWDDMPNKKSVRIYASRTVDASSPFEDDTSLVEFAVDAMLGMNRSFRPAIKALPAA